MEVKLVLIYNRPNNLLDDYYQLIKEKCDKIFEDEVIYNDQKVTFSNFNFFIN